MKILICDDSMTVRKKLIQSIRAVKECEIIEANNGDVAVLAYKEHKPNLVFMDIMMPIKDGLESLAEIILEDANAKVVMLSSVGTKSNLQTALKIGAIDFIQKPCEESRLKQLIDTYGGEA
ncbi:response regulator transcription factor [Petrocella sp. FN5]|uniref:response regulator transcription factor n=1 Tax=Petrocella sp. FN5 TaxID=3032002 RepID=UPI0023DCA7C3|nr:response regulator [Petrocella sp. FN5]MCF8019736.1 response regulator [Vallitaleaceae bacterium]MDF1617990.1 response regulator [Petrocella sp. FN5]